MHRTTLKGTLIVLRVSLLIVLFSAQVIFPAIIPQSVKQLTNNSTDIIKGTVISQKAQWNESHNMIFTTVKVRVSESFKGNLKSTKEITIWVPGGQVGDTGLAVEHAANFEKSQDVILFLTKIDNSYYDVTSWELGKYSIVNGIVQEKKIPVSNFINEIKSSIR